MSIENIEIENQIDAAPFPILLSQNCSNEKDTSPFLNMEIYMVKMK